MRSEPTADVDERLEAVSHTERRQVLYMLLGKIRGGDSRNGDSSVRIDSVYQGPESEKLMRALYHNHLPKLEDGGFVVVDTERDRIEPGPQFSEIVPLLDHLASVTPEVAEGSGASDRYS